MVYGETFLRNFKFYAKTLTKLHDLTVLLGLRAAPKEDSGVSSSELVLGSPLTLPGEFLHGEEPPAEDFLQYMRDFPPPCLYLRDL